MKQKSTSSPARLFHFLWLVLVLAAPVSRAVAADDPVGLEFFESKIRPLLVDNCYPCHSQAAGKSKGALLVDSRDGLLKGGDTGPAVVPGNLDASLLITAIRYHDDKLQMPPKDKKLSDASIALFEAWVKMGAPDPRVTAPVGLVKFDTIRQNAKTHWAFQPVHQPLLPKVNNTRFVQTPIDNFILSRLEAAHLRPSPRADKRTLIRRATFDLIGLPPTTEEVTAFVGDKSPDAFARVVDRLLASPHYGERWGRHWLDVARYADTKGYVFEEDRHYAYSYTYRDYVIRAFNEDLPYNQFIREQIAADLIPNHDPKSLAALGYLTLGRRFVNNIHDIIDDRIDVVCRGTMGLTVACARCHDHKYDPIPTKDYYSLYGIFDSSYEPSDNEPLLGTPAPEEAHKKYVVEHQKRQDALDKYHHDNEKKMSDEIRSHSGDYLLAAHEAKVSTDTLAVDTIAHKYKIHPEILRRWMTSLDAWQKSTNAIFAPWFALVALPEKDFPAQAKPLAENFAANKNKSVNPLVAAMFTNAPASLKEVADRYDKLFNDINGQWLGAIASTNSPAPTALADVSAETVRQILYAVDAPDSFPTSEYPVLYETAVSQEIRRLKRDVDELDATDPGAPPRAMALLDKGDPHDDNIFVRGNSGNQGPVAPREFLEALSSTNRQPFKLGSGRLELADDIASTNNPLTARVFVNRVWLHHFGSPLVSTPSDFGLRSDPPTNPQLLDYLASCFMADGWSVKKLQRLILLSAAYQQSSDDNLAADKIDPANNLYWRMNRQRLEFEPTRDTLLAVSGRLDLDAGGRPVDITAADSNRRTVYGYVDRQNLPDLFRAFDFASPDTTSPRRFYTTVPQQALFLMNNPFVIEQAQSLVHRPAFTNAPTEQAQVRQLYELAFQREPNSDELALAHDFLHHDPGGPPPAAVAAESQWRFGYGGFDDATKRIVKFKKLPFYDGRALQGGPTLPDPKLGWVVVSGTGGHPGSDQEHASIRRWVAPRNGTITIEGTLHHPDEHGDGVRSRIVSSKLGVVGEWLVHNRKQETQVASLKVSAGDKIDFATDCLVENSYDSYTWSPKIRYLADGKTQPGQQMEWNALADFADAARGEKSPPPELNAWERYAQVLLLSNELIFVD